ncbi:MAG TPA: uracil phosphoribosyltransferase [Thermohalobaculum sp.]|nr:uracil phosphoribosyltransferase [Thermohalobaculum sp.]
MDGLTVIGHPLVEHKLTLLRDRATPSPEVRRLMHELAGLLAYEALADLPLEDVRIETPLAPMTARRLARGVCFVSILRAAEGLVPGLIALVPSARVGHVGLYRDEETLRPVRYYCKLPADIGARAVVVADPMLATGGTAVEAIRQIKLAGARDIRFLCLVAAPEGVAALRSAHADVAVFAGALDERLNSEGFILPGLGDAGDRLFGTE